ncbi:snRNA-activating protein complex subunit 1 isoform X2 [Venturia canescens]|uniref:snRNA-activating protein complex subunit 1 isoform X2 n=1 Tax=Venturia canescens TaxID=32260 RepID=UPI001C9D0813|nr:snRNA-activating protein complex subunit 1 isoform X2 [Venturia canescens]
MAENRSSSHCLIGFREDCAKLIDRFGKLGTVRFQGFADIWRDMKLSLIFGGRKSLMEQIEFCEDTLIEAKEFFLPPLSFKERIGGLYLLYALYFKMPLKGPKIRVKIEDWQDIVEIRGEIVQAEHHDASFILSKLMLENAFVHSSLEQEFALEKSYRLKGSKLRNTYSILSDIRELAGPGDLLNRVNVFGEYYRLIKACETEDRSTKDHRRTIRPPECLKLYDSSFGKHLLDAVEQLENSRKFIKFAKTRGLSTPDDSSIQNTQPEVEKAQFAFFVPRGGRKDARFDQVKQCSEEKVSLKKRYRYSATWQVPDKTIGGL